MHSPTTTSQDISSDSDDEGGPKFGIVALTAPSRNIVRWWLAQARRRLRLREVVQPLINKARGAQCEICLSRKQLQVECIIPLEVLAAKVSPSGSATSRQPQTNRPSNRPTAPFHPRTNARTPSSLRPPYRPSSHASPPHTHAPPRTPTSLTRSTLTKSSTKSSGRHSGCATSSTRPCASSV